MIFKENRRELSAVRDAEREAFIKRRRELSEARDAVVRQTNPNPNS